MQDGFRNVKLRNRQHGTLLLRDVSVDDNATKEGRGKPQNPGKWGQLVPKQASYMEGKERLKIEADLSRLAGGRFNEKGTHTRGLSCMPQDGELSPRAPQDLNSFYRGHGGIQSHFPSRWSQGLLSQLTPYSLKAMSLEQLLVWEWGRDIHRKDRGQDGEPPIAQVLLRGQPAVIFSADLLRQGGRDHDGEMNLGVPGVVGIFYSRPCWWWHGYLLTIYVTPCVRGFCSFKNIFH